MPFKLVFMAGPKPMQTEFGIHHRLESYVSRFYPKSNSKYFRRPTVKQMLQLPAVQKEVKRRQRQLAREEMWSGLVALFTPIIFLAVWAWNNLCLQPVAALRRFWVDTDNKTPPNSIHQPNDDSFKVTNSLRMLASRFQLTIVVACYCHLSAV